METVSSFFSWLFGTRQGVAWLVGGGVILFLLVAIILERTTKSRYYNHQKTDEDWDLFDVDEDEDDAVDS